MEECVGMQDCVASALDETQTSVYVVLLVSEINSTVCQPQTLQELVRMPHTHTHTHTHSSTTVFIFDNNYNK